MISQESRRVAGIVLVVLPTVIYGGVSLLTMLIRSGSGQTETPPLAKAAKDGAPSWFNFVADD